jgi:hypothetical protein
VTVATPLIDLSVDRAPRALGTRPIGPTLVMASLHAAEIDADQLLTWASVAAVERAAAPAEPIPDVTSWHHRPPSRSPTPSRSPIMLTLVPRTPINYNL